MGQRRPCKRPTWSTHPPPNWLGRPAHPDPSCARPWRSMRRRAPATPPPTPPPAHSALRISMLTEGVFKACLDDAVAAVREDVRNLHMEVLKQFHVQQVRRPRRPRLCARVRARAWGPASVHVHACVRGQETTWLWGWPPGPWVWRQLAVGLHPAFLFDGPPAASLAASCPNNSLLPPSPHPCTDGGEQQHAGAGQHHACAAGGARGGGPGAQAAARWERGGRL